MTKYATIAQAARRWDVDRATARTAIRDAGIAPSDLYASPRYPWCQILQRIEGWAAEFVDTIDETAVLHCANDLADQFGVTPQTIRNYGRSGRIRAVWITPRTVGYALAPVAECTGEAKIEEPTK